MSDAFVTEVDGELVLVDPVASAVIKSIRKHNCIASFTVNEERITHFRNRVVERGEDPHKLVIVVLNVNDEAGGALAEMLMPGHDWQAYRDRGEIPFARGLAVREGIEAALDFIDPESAEKLKKFDGLAVVVVDHETAEIF